MIKRISFFIFIITFSLILASPGHANNVVFPEDEKFGKTPDGLADWSSAAQLGQLAYDTNAQNFVIEGMGITLNGAAPEINIDTGVFTISADTGISKGTDRIMRNIKVVGQNDKHDSVGLKDGTNNHIFVTVGPGTDSIEFDTNTTGTNPSVNSSDTISLEIALVNTTADTIDERNRQPYGRYDQINLRRDPNDNFEAATKQYVDNNAGGGGGAFEAKLLHVADSKPIGTAGGSASETAKLRVLNHVFTNEISGASLQADTITLPAGKYFIEASAPAYQVSRHRSFVIDDSNDTLITSRVAYAYVTNPDLSYAVMEGRFTLTTETSIGIYTQVQTANASNGLGLESSMGEFEKYTEVKIWKVD